MLTAFLFYMTTAILISVWVLGYITSYAMQRTEMAAENEYYSKGDRLLIFVLSLLSFIWVVVMLITAWVKLIGITGYWTTPVERVAEELNIKPTKTSAN